MYAALLITVTMPFLWWQQLTQVDKQLTT